MVKNKITLNVLADINRKISNGDSREYKNLQGHYDRNANNYVNLTKSPKTYRDKALVVITGTNINIDEKLNYLSELGKSGVKLSLAFSAMGQEILDLNRIKRLLEPDKIYLEEDILELKNISLEYDYLIAPNITINTMSKITQGYIDGLIPNLIWTFLYLGKDVYMDFESTLYYLGLACKNDRIEEIILEQIEEIKSIGVIEIGSNSYIETIYKNKHLSNGLDTTSRADKTKRADKRKIYTQNDIDSSLVKGNTLVLPRASILTPLAKDKVKSMGISIKFE